MNTSSLALGQSQRQATDVRVQARRLNERIALRAGLALIAWSRRQNERLSHEVRAKESGPLVRGRFLHALP